MMELDKAWFEAPNRIGGMINTDKLIGRMAACLLEDGYPINIGDYISKCAIYGHIHVLKKLGLYKVSGKGKTKAVKVNPKVLLNMKLTVCTPLVFGQTLIALWAGEFAGLSFGEIDFTAYNALDMSFIKPPRPKPYFSTYLFLNKDNGLIKIGRSKHVFTRLLQVQKEVGTKNVDVIAYKILDIEALLHIEHRFKRNFGEWFNLSLDEAFDIIKKHSFDTIVNIQHKYKVE